MNKKRINNEELHFKLVGLLDNIIITAKIKSILFMIGRLDIMNPDALIR